MDHYLASTPQNLHWGPVDRPQDPVINIATGDRVTDRNAARRTRTTVPGVPADIDAATEGSAPIAPRLLTGPVHIRDAGFLRRRAGSAGSRYSIAGGLGLEHADSRRELIDFCRQYVSLDRARNIARACRGDVNSRSRPASAISASRRRATGVNVRSAVISDEDLGIELRCVLSRLRQRRPVLRRATATRCSTTAMSI